jgi:hypothetical protein
LPAKWLTAGFHSPGAIQPSKAGRFVPRIRDQRKDAARAGFMDCLRVWECSREDRAALLRWVSPVKHIGRAPLSRQQKARRRRFDPATGETVSTDANQENTMSESYNGESRQRKATIIRRKLSTNYTTLPNEIFDHGLSLEAVGLLAYLLGRSRNWRVIPKQLCEKFGCGRDKTYRLLDELIAAGFVQRSRSGRGHGKCGYTVFDQPRSFPEKPEMIPRSFPENTDERSFPENTDGSFPENTDAYQRKTPYQGKTERKEALSTERKNDASHRIALARDADVVDAPLHMNGFAKEAKQESGCPIEASKQESDDLEAIEFVQLMLDGDGDPRTIGAIVAMCQQPGQYEYPGIDGRLLARAAKAGHFIRVGELLLTHRQAAELRQEEQPAPIAPPVSARRGSVIVANFEEAQRLRAEILREGAEHEAQMAARLRR